MNRNLYRYPGAALLAAACLWSCAQSPKPAEHGSAPEVSAAAAAEEVPAVLSPAATAPAENRLKDPVFRNLPAEARSYLERLSRAFSARDEAFLLDQGEPQFEAENRTRFDKETYLALLYRIGAYAADSPRMSQEPSRLVLAGVSRIEYLAWEEKGPLLEIKARLIGADGKATPCLIMLVWKLREPKIEGLFL
jgi:hypothetical protein